MLVTQPVLSTTNERKLSEMVEYVRRSLLGAGWSGKGSLRRWHCTEPWMVRRSHTRGEECSGGGYRNSSMVEVGLGCLRNIKSQKVWSIVSRYVRWGRPDNGRHCKKFGFCSTWGEATCERVGEMLVLPFSPLSVYYETDIVLCTGEMKQTFLVFSVYRSLLAFFVGEETVDG